MKKDTIIAILATFCLTASLFMVSSSLGYDPWADINDDGKIDMKDIGYEARLFGTTGNSTKNVTVTNWPESHRSVPYVVDQTVPLPMNPLIMGYSFGVPDVNVEGYSRMSVYIKVWGFDATPEANVQFGVRDLYWSNQGVRTDTADIPISGEWWPYFNCTLGNRTYAGVKTFETFGPSVEITLGAFSPTQSLSLQVTMTVYLRNE